MDQLSTERAEQSVLLIADHAMKPPEIDRLSKAIGDRPLLLLDLSPDARASVGSLDAQRLRIDALLDLDRYHRDVVEFLDRWPRETLVDGRPFGEVFRQTTGHSLWWTGPGSLRHPFSGPILPVLRGIWIARAAIESTRPQMVISCLSDGRIASLLPRTCRTHNADHIALSRAKAGRVSARSWWLAGSMFSLIALACWIVMRAVYARLVTRPRCTPHDGPTIVMSGWYPNHVSNDAAGRPQVVYWQRLAEVLQQEPNIAVRYLLYTTSFRFDGWERLLRPFYTGWSRLRRIEDLLPLPQCFAQLQPYLRGAVQQLRMMRVYARFERGGGPMTAPTFAGIDVSPLIVPQLRSAVASMAKWSRNVSAVAASIECGGDVRGVLVHEEFYPKGMLTIAAAQSLGIPTLGVQHGQVGPQHAVYMPPPGHMIDGPSPDWFAAYGESVRPILCEVGAYPAEKIRIVGAPRFDDPATHAADRQVCRRALGWEDAQPVVLVTTETFTLSAPILRALIPLAREQPAWRFVVKLHPHDRDPQWYAQLLDDARTGNIELVTDRLAERLAACDVLVTGYSTTAMEGLLAGRPVICADFTTWPDRYPYVPGRAALPARSGEALRAAIVRSLEAPSPLPRRDAFLREHLGPTLEGRAAETFAATLAELLRLDT